MKELSIEQKARAYDEALRIRKALIDFFGKGAENGEQTNGICDKDILAWLEKQGEQKPVDSYCQENCKGFQETGKCFSDGDCKAKREAESTNKVEQRLINEIEIPFGAKDSELQEETYFIPKGFHAEIDDDKVVIKKGEKPTAWSKKDEKMFEYALNMIEWYSGKNEDKSRFVSDWLKFIKQRIGG